MKRRSTSYLCLVLALGLAVALASAFLAGMRDARAAADSPSSTFVVTNTNDAGPGSLREAIIDANANPGADLIDISTSGTVLLLSPLPVITDSVTLQGPGAGDFAVDGDNSFRVFEIDRTDVSLAGLTIQHGFVSGAEYGGGIHSTGSLSLENVEVLSNTAQSYGGGLYGEGNITITGGVVRNNASTNSVGGGMRTVGTTVISGTQFIGNTSRGDGGGAFVLGKLVIRGALFRENRCSASSCDGAGLFGFSQTEIYNTQVISNTAQDHGGGVAASGTLTISASLFHNNQAVFGTGGGLFAQTMVTIQGSEFLSNTSRSSGGGVHASGTASLNGVIIHGNQSTTSTGGGVYAGGDVSITDTQFIRNTALEGGGISHALGEASIVNTLFADNVATNTPGMALLLGSVDQVEVLHTTIAGYATASGSAIEVLAGSVEITNTIVTSHTVGINNTGASVQQDFNLFYGNATDTQGVVSGGSNSLNSDPLFVDPSGYDYHLGEGSAAIDAGMDAGVTIDIDGDIRPMGPGFDIGFDEAIHAPEAELSHLFLPWIQK